MLITNTDFSADQVTLKYKELWQVEQVFRDVKSTLETRPVYHQRDENIRGLVFCSFLALVFCFNEPPCSKLQGIKLKIICLLT